MRGCFALLISVVTDAYDADLQEEIRQLQGVVKAMTQVVDEANQAAQRAKDELQRKCRAVNSSDEYCRSV